MEQESKEHLDLNIDELSKQGSSIYDARLKAELEPAQNGRFVAIHVDTGDYVVARWSGDAMRAMHNLHPNSRLFVRKIGDEPEYSLASRILMSEMMAGQAK
jgi:hypothetical protein